jgi:hypothetical protein
VKSLIQPGILWGRDYLEERVRHIHRMFSEFARKLSAFRVPEPLLQIPDVILPPRHARLNPGVLVRLLAEDIASQIEAGQSLDQALAAGAAEPRDVLAWSDHCAEILAGVGDEVKTGLTRLTKGATACSAPVADPIILGRAYLALGLGFLKEVQQRMNDYAEAAGQVPPQPQVSIVIRGGTFYGSQIAAQIANIESTITGVAQHGDRDLADGLKELTQAVLVQDGLDDEQRQDLLDNVGYLAEAAGKPSEKRNRGIIKSVLGALGTAAATSTELGKAMDAWGGVLHQLLS